MDKDYIWVCENCMETSKTSYGARRRKCEFCGGKFLRTDKDEDEWDALFYKTHPHKNGKNTICREIDDFIAETFLGNSDTVNKELVEDRNFELDMMGDYLERLGNKPRCPKCGSTKLDKERKGYSVGKAVATTALTGFLDVGLLAGTAGQNKLVNVCRECGHRFK